MIDLHSHILFGLDDGASHLAESLAMARTAVDSGIDVMAATPHIREDHPFELAEAERRRAELRDALATEGLPLEVVGGGEVAATKVAELGPEGLAGLCLGDGDYVLLESPYVEVGVLFETAVFDLMAWGFRPLLAHPERSPTFHDDVERLASLVDRGVRCSVTAGSMAGRFGRTVRRFTTHLFELGLVHNVASDSHDVAHRAPGLREGFAALGKELPRLDSSIDWFCDEVPAAVLAGEELPGVAPQVRRRRFRLSRVG